MQQIKITELKKIADTYKYGYTRLLKDDGSAIVNWNSTPKKINQNFTLMKDRLQPLPDGYYYVEFKYSVKSNPERFFINKGNIKEAPAAAPSMLPVIHQAAPLDKFQTMEEWKRQEKRIAELERELDLLKMKNTLQEAGKPVEPPAAVGWLKDVAPMFLPILDKYMTIKEKEVEQKSQEKTEVKKRNPLDTYFKKFEALSDEEADAEVNRLKETNPKLHNIIIQRYYEEGSQEVQ